MALAVWDYGGGDPVLLLSHCNGGVARMWDPVAAALSPRFHVLALDHRGHGASARPETQDAYVWSASAADLLAVRGALVPGGLCYGAGHSSGAAFLAQAEAMRPGSFAALTLFDPIIGVRFRTALEYPMAEQARRRRAHFDSRDAARAHFASKPPMDAWDPAVFDAYLRHGLEDDGAGGVTLACRPEIEAWVFEGGGEADTEAGLSRIACPCQVVAGGDPFIAEAAEAAAQALPNASFRTLSGVSHFIPQERPDTAAECIAAWLPGE